jgi:hypothetical protein
MSAINVNRRVAPVQERENLKREINILKKDEAGDSPEFSREMKKFISQNPDVNSGGGHNQRQLNRMERVLKNSEPQDLTDDEIKTLETEEKVLTDQCQKMMIPKKLTDLKEFDGSAISTEFRKAANAMSKKEHSKEFLDMAHKLKNIKRLLRPDDPDAGNLEFIRPD